MIPRPARIRLSHQNLLHNAHLARKLAPHSSLMAVVKADAYGHGARDCIATLKDTANTFAVATVSEARALLEDSPFSEVPLTVLHGAHHFDDLDYALAHGLGLVLHDQQQLTLWERHPKPPKTPIPLWLKINTGMNRLGIPPDQADSVCQRLSALNWSQQPVGLMTHLACADELDSDFTRTQLTLFNDTCGPLIEHYSSECSAANSAGLLNYPDSHLDWVRPGLMLYGLSPTPGIDHTLRPVMTLEAPLLTTRDCQAGDCIGYDAAYTCPAAMRIGILEAGYADGYPRAAGGQANVYLNQHHCPVLGRVSMDLIAIDLTDVPAEPGDWAELWGEHIRLETLAEQCSTITYELLCSAGNLCRRE